MGWYLISGSGTSGGNRNPAFTVIDWDEEFMVPINTHTYIMNITEANLAPEKIPEVFELHDMINEYGMIDLSPS